MNTSLTALQKSLEEAKVQIERLKRAYPPDERLVNEFDGVLDIEMGLDWTLKQVEFFAAHNPNCAATDEADYGVCFTQDADFDYESMS